MRITIILILVLLQNLSFGQIEISVNNDILYVNTKSGIKLRNEPNNSAEYLNIIQYGDSIRFLENSGYTEVIENRLGNWIKVEFENKMGFIFSGYVTKSKPLKYSTDKYDCHDLEYLREWIHNRLELDSIVNSGNRIEYYELDEERGKFHVKWNQYKNGAIITEVMGYEYHNHIYETYSLNSNDLLNMIDYYVYNNNMNCKDDKYYTLPNLTLEYRNNGSLKSIESKELGRLRIEILDFKTTIEISYEM